MVSSAPSQPVPGDGEVAAVVPRSDEEFDELVAKLHEAHQMIDAIRRGGVDSLVIGPPGEEHVYDLSGTDSTYRFIVERMNEGAATVDDHGAILYANARLGSMIGCPAQQLIGTPTLELITQEHREAFAHLLDVGPGGSARGELELARADGTTVPSAVAVTALDVEGTHLRFLLMSDHGALSPARQEHAGSHETNRPSDDVYQRLFDDAPIGIAHVDAGGRILRVNAQLCQITGYGERELCSRGIEDITHADDWAAEHAAMERLTSGVVETFRTQPRFVTKGAGAVLLEVAGAHVRKTNGDAASMVMTFRELANGTRAEPEAQPEAQPARSDLEAGPPRAADVQRRDVNMESITDSAAHALRTLSRSLGGFSEALVDEYADRLDTVGRAYANHIERGVQRMDQLADGVVELTRLSRARLHLETLDLSAEVRAIATELQRVEPAWRVDFVIADAVTARADVVLMRAALEQLLDNARRSTAGREEAHIEFGTIAVDDAPTCCYIRDNGVGFDPSDADALFLPFQQSQPNREWAGSGVGLAGVRQIVERHGGRIWAEGAVDRGATFFFTLDAENAG